MLSRQNWSPVGESNAVSSVYNTAASPAMLTGQIGAPPTIRTSRLSLTKGLHRRLCCRAKWSPETELNSRKVPSEGTSRIRRAGENWYPVQESNLPLKTFVAFSPRPSDGVLIGSPPWCRSRPLPLIWPLSALYKGAPLAGAVEKIGCGRWNRTTDVRLMRPTFYH
jgi:hypothetical protein